MRMIALTFALLWALPAVAQSLPPTPGKPLPPLPTKNQKSPPAQALPGLGVMPGDSGDYKIQVVPVSADRNTVINVSQSLANRIATPFTNPTAIDNQSNDFDVKSVGQSLYVTPKTNNSIALYVTGDGPNDPVISLTLNPVAIPAQTITLQLDRASASTNGEGAYAEKAPDSNVYTEKIRYVLRQIALGKLPQGFSEGALPRSVAQMGPISAYPLSRFSGPAYEVYRYKIEAVADNVELDEGAFYGEGVRAVAFFPLSSLRKGESTEVYVVSDKVESY